MNVGILAGATEVDITPPVGLDMTGFGDRPSGSVGVHDPLFARALVLAPGPGHPGSPVALVSMDLLSLDFDLVARVREAVSETAGIGADHLFLNASHTHHGPATIRLRGLGSRDEAYASSLVERLAEGVARAGGRLQPVRLLAGRAPVEVGVNRRVSGPDGRAVFGENAEAPADREVRVLRVERTDGTPLAAAFHHAVHGVCVGRRNLETTADFAGYACERVRRSLEGDPVPLFFQGCAGNINPRDAVQGTFDLAERIGHRLGDAAVEAWHRATPLDPPLSLKAARKTLRLPLADPPSPERARAELDRWRVKLEAVRASTDNRGTIEVHEGFVAWAGKIVQLAEEGPRDRFQDFELQALAIGSFALMGMPGEVFFEYAARIEAASPFPCTMVLAYHNGCVGYVPTAAAFAEGGYEVETAIRLYGTLMMRPESEERIVAGALALLASLR